jgi:hypothetical protein
MKQWQLIGLFVLLGIISGGGECADFKASSFSASERSLLHPIAAHKKKGQRKKKSRRHKHKRSQSKKHHQTPAKTQKMLENYAVEGECNRLACSSNIKRAKSCLKTRRLRKTHPKCFRAFCRYGCNDIDYHANQEVFGLCNRICSSRKYKVAH